MVRAVRDRLLIVAFVCIGLILVGVLFIARPRMVEMPIGAPSVQSSTDLATGDSDAVLLADCLGSAQGIVTRSEVLIRKHARDGDLDLPPTSGSSVVVAEKGWLGTYRFRLLTPDGATIELEPTNRFLSCNRE